LTKLGYIHIRIISSMLVGLLAVLLILASWYYRDDLFQSIYDPGEPFQTMALPPAPDYSNASGWLVRPDVNIDPIDIPGGDIFVISPTLFLGRTHWNAPTGSEKLKANFERIVLPNYILPYKSAGRIYAPQYRQAALYTFLNNRDDSVLAMEFAYQDVRRAFEVFIAENPPERPIVLVGYGQGGLHAQRLLSEYFGADLRRKLATAYIIDYPFLLDNTSGLKPCGRKQDTNCVIAFGAFEPKERARVRRFAGKTLVWNPLENGSMQSVAGRPLLCVNPLLWTMDSDYAPARLHLGGVAAEGLGFETMPVPIPHQTGAQCQDGVLLLDKPKLKNLRRPSRFGGKYRTLSSNLFYEDLRVDAVRRVQYLIDKDILPKRAPLLEMETIEIEDSPVTLPLKPLKQ
jgi:Protein of unknown function (DUF3089)